MYVLRPPCVTAACVFVLKSGRYNDMDFHFSLLFICDPDLFLNNLVVKAFFFPFFIEIIECSFGILVI